MSQECAAEERLELIHVNVDHGSGEEREHLAQNQAAYDGNAQRPAEFGTSAHADGQRHSP